MKSLIGVGLGCAACLALLSPSVAKEKQILLLNLQYKSDANTTREIQFYGNDIDPNSRSTQDRFSLMIDGKSVELPEDLYRRLDGLRRSFSYDSLSGGIEAPNTGGPRCLLGGSAKGMLLEARYLTYESSKIVNDEMQPVFGMAQNCLFQERYKPANANSQEDARAVIEILNTISLLDS